ncbi:MAG TPA: hypothetical protein VJS92_10160, partial [Candidatus Polarisedimenticolaceae bacterium]|nr:hypothetical protein [Candidatus Polarisedimenticolaceae bacterium]
MNAVPLLLLRIATRPFERLAALGSGNAAALAEKLLALEARLEERARRLEAALHEAAGAREAAVDEERARVR